MTEISVGLKAGRKVAIVATGHTGFSERGSDVVCAGVSALVQALFYGFHEVLKQRGLRSAIDKENAKMSLDWTECSASEMSWRRPFWLAKELPGFIPIMSELWRCT